jgi:hypothetical protein
MAAGNSVAAVPAAYERDADRNGMESAPERHAEYPATVR